MKKYMRICALALCLLLVCSASCALAAIKEPKAKTLENTTSYDYGTLKIQIDQWCYNFSKKEDLRFFVAHVYTERPDQLQTAFAGEKYSRDSAEATSAIAARHDAVIAINGDYYNFKEDNGMVIRNGVHYRDARSTRDHLLVDKDGMFSILPRADYEAGQGDALVAQGITQCFTFGPALVSGGVAIEIPKKYNISTKDTQREPRTAIGQVDANHYVLIVADGRRNDWSEKGMTLQELQQIFVEQGCQVAYNLDGGGSATLILEGQKINMGSTSRERDVSDIIFFTK